MTYEQGTKSILWLSTILMLIFLLLTLLLIGKEVTAERSSEPKLYCWYNADNGIVVYEYECLSTNEFLTDQGEVFNSKSCVSWEDYNGKKKKNITK